MKRVLLRWLATAAVLLCCAHPLDCLAGTAPLDADGGRSIFLHGLGADGQAVRARRGAGPELTGQAVACANCHKRSGLGGHEGRSVVPPVTGQYLFRPAARPGKDLDIPFVEGMRGDREPYTDETLARAIREGLDAQGKPLTYLMPTYALSDTEMAALIAHLKKLDRRHVPGVNETTLHFATIITPDADPVKRRGMLNVLNQFFEDRNVRQMVPAPHLLTSGKTAYAGTMFKVQRRWELHVWELTGPEATWQDQLEKHLASEPVFAVVSGLGGRTWAPVQAFCERAALPCLFPNVDAPPPEADQDFYSIYFSRGVLLEAGLIGKSLAGGDGAPAPAKTVLQILRAGDVGEAGAAALAAELKGRGVTVSATVLPRDAPAAAAGEVLRKAGRTDSLVLWLRPPDLAALPEVTPEGVGEVYVSGLMGGAERAPLPSAWRTEARIAYPFDLPDRRRVRVDYALGWMRGRHMPLVADQVQIDTYLACGLLSETLKSMADTFVPEYLIERFEDTLAHRIVTGYYPRLGMANGQRFASKGGYVVRFAGPQGTAISADGDWTVP